MESFTALDYAAKTPKWALFGSNERGFDPVDTRFQRKKTKDISGCQTQFSAVTLTFLSKPLA